MRSIRTVLTARPERTLAVVVLALGVVVMAATSAPPSNFVSVFDDGATACWSDLHPNFPWSPQGGASDAKEEGEAGRAFAATWNLKLQGVRPEAQAQARYQECGFWVPLS